MRFFNSLPPESLPHQLVCAFLISIHTGSKTKGRDTRCRASSSFISFNCTGHCSGTWSIYSPGLLPAFFYFSSWSKRGRWEYLAEINSCVNQPATTKNDPQISALHVLNTPACIRDWMTSQEGNQSISCYGIDSIQMCQHSVGASVGIYCGPALTHSPTVIRIPHLASTIIKLHFATVIVTERYSSSSSSAPHSPTTVQGYWGREVTNRHLVYGRYWLSSCCCWWWWLVAHWLLWIRQPGNDERVKMFPIWLKCEICQFCCDAKCRRHSIRVISTIVQCRWIGWHADYYYYYNYCCCVILLWNSKHCVSRSAGRQRGSRDVSAASSQFVTIL